MSVKHKLGQPRAETLVEVPLTDIVIKDQSLRYDPKSDEVAEMALSIQRQGLLQPIGLEPAENGAFQLLWGGRRLAAHERLNKKIILARIFDKGDSSVKTIALIENLQRRDLSLEEEVTAVNHLHNVEQLSPDQISTRLSKGRHWVMVRIGLPNFPPDVSEAALHEEIPLGMAEVIGAVKDDGFRAYILNYAKVHKPSIAEVRTIVQTAQTSPAGVGNMEEAVQAGLAAAADPRVFLECDHCHTKRERSQFILIRVCKDGCPTPQYEQQEK